ncbi:MAG: hypothetical protein ACKVP0_24170 [Pirellulaceae bacterium]
MKFSIRDLFLVTVIVALALGWWANRREHIAEVSKLRRQVNALHEKAMFLQTKADEAMWRLGNRSQATPNSALPALDSPQDLTSPHAGP